MVRYWLPNFSVCCSRIFLVRERTVCFIGVERLANLVGMFSRVLTQQPSGALLQACTHEIADFGVRTNERIVWFIAPFHFLTICDLRRHGASTVPLGWTRERVLSVVRVESGYLSFWRWYHHFTPLQRSVSLCTA